MPTHDQSPHCKKIWKAVLYKRCQQSTVCKSQLCWYLGTKVGGKAGSDKLHAQMRIHVRAVCRILERNKVKVKASFIEVI